MSPIGLPPMRFGAWRDDTIQQRKQAQELDSPAKIRDAVKAVDDQIGPEGCVENKLRRHEGIVEPFELKFFKVIESSKAELLQALYNAFDASENYYPSVKLAQTLDTMMQALGMKTHTAESNTKIHAGDEFLDLSDSDDSILIFKDSPAGDDFSLGDDEGDLSLDPEKEALGTDEDEDVFTFAGDEAFEEDSEFNDSDDETPPKAGWAERLWKWLHDKPKK